MLIFTLGAIFGLLIRYANLNRFDTISGNARLTNLTVAKTIMLAIGLGSILLCTEIFLGGASFHVKPFVVGGIVLGGLIFGTGMAILGYCPGTLPISVGEGSVDALVGVVGGLFGGLVYTLVLPTIAPILGPNLGNLSLESVTSGHTGIYFTLLILFGLALIAVSLFLHKYESNKSAEKASNYKWLVTGVGIAILNVIVFSKFATNRPIGASTSFPYLADLIANVTENEYFKKIATPGAWEVKFLAGSMIAAFVQSVIKKEFSFKVIHAGWKETKGDSKANRLVWSFVGGFILLFGARMAGGCTSGHVISGGMQVAFSSLVFGFFVFLSFLTVGKFFYSTKK